MNQTKSVVGGGKIQYETPSVELLNMSFNSGAICTSVLNAEMSVALLDDGEIEVLTW